MPDVSENLLFELERHCNNYFNPRNNPGDPQRNYPPAFLELAAQIADYKKNVDKNNITHETNASYNITTDLNYTSWQKAFAREISLYRRVKSL